MSHYASLSIGVCDLKSKDIHRRIEPACLLKSDVELMTLRETGVAVTNQISWPLEQSGTEELTWFLMYYGREFSGRLVDLWAYANQVTLEFSRPGKPTDNAFIESFNGSLRDECLNVHWFQDLTDAKDKLQAWMQEYNESRPHRSLNNLSPLEYKARWAHKQPEIN